MALEERDRAVLWRAVYAIVMAYEHGAVSLDEAKDVVEVICTGTAVVPDPDRN